MFEFLSKIKKLDKAKKMFQRAVDADREWQGGAIQDFNFRDGEQWTNEEKRILAEELRPCMTFNLTKSQVDLIMGMNEDNRITHRCSPVEPLDGFLSELLNDISDWVRETNEFDDEEDMALESAAICGRGYVALDVSPDPKKFGDIKIQEIVVPVREVHPDPSARRPNWSDASYICWDRWIGIEDFKIKYPKIRGKALKELISEGLGHGIDSIAEGQPQEYFEPEFDISGDDSDYDMPLDLNYYDRTKNMIRLVHMEYWKNYTRYYVFDPIVGDFQEVPNKPSTEDKALFLQEFGEEMVIETMQDKKVMWLQFTGDRILYDGDSPIIFPGFSIVPMFAFRDVSMRTADHFGIVRLMKDPQREINKRWSQALNMLNNQVQPGVFAEAETFVDEAQAQASMKEAGGITYLNPGGLSKMKERQVPTFPNAPMQMEQFSQDILKKITGINPDLLGQDRGRQEPGVVVRLRQQQGMTLLKPLFNGLNRMKKGLFKRQLAIIMQFMPNSQILKILGQNDRYQVFKETGEIVDTMLGLKANIRAVRELEYNIKAEEATGNMSKRMMEMQMLMEMMEKNFPVDPMQIIEKLELPESEKVRWMNYITQQQKAQAQEKQQMLAKEIEFKEREMADDERETTLEFIVDMAKIKQMGEKDEKSMITNFAKMSVEEQRNLMQFTAQMASVAAQAVQQEQEMAIDAKRAKQELGQDANAHKQDMAFDREKQALDLKAAEEKQTQAMRFAKEKAAIANAQAKKQGGTYGRAQSNSRK